MFFHKRILIHTSLGHEEYLEIVNKLAVAGISFKTKSRNSSHFLGGNSYLPMSFRDKTVQYDIYVNVEDQYKAQQAIHNREVSIPEKTTPPVR